jgi:hypothetical protein
MAHCAAASGSIALASGPEPPASGHSCLNLGLVGEVGHADEYVAAGVGVEGG